MVKKDNIILNLEKNAIEVAETKYDLDENSILVQIRHTLIDTREGMGCFSALNRVNENSFYYGYISIGEIIDIGKNVRYCRKGMNVLIPAVYQKYVVISEQEKQRLNQIIFYVLPDNLGADLVQALFYPLLSVANAIIEHLKEDGTARIILAGCYALGGILIKLCMLNDISCEVLLGTKDVSKLFVEGNGGEITTLSGLSESREKVIIMETLAGLEYSQQLDNKRYINVNKLIAEEYATCAWMDCYIQSSNDEILRNYDIDVSDMIGQHVHAEAAKETYSDICDGRYQGKLLVYDW